ncbi:MAG TPA: LamG-like jellyroll fold domain-containing protein [Paraburkholderia sp.]|uniref:DUF7402 domain-containing protein n=1 Tax=Paraburkholderia sp. TaxID=1926495 RepID=UPI002ED6A002
MLTIRRIRKLLSVNLILSTLLIVAPFWGSTSYVSAQWVAGSAPFINSWLVSGPFDTAKAEEIYGVVRPADGNWARVAMASATSTWKTTAADYPTGIDVPGTAPSKAIDGDRTTDWVSQTMNTYGSPSTWPAWDPTPTLFLTWTQPIKVKQIEVFDRYDASWPSGLSDVQQVNYTLKDVSGAVLQTGSITNIDPTGVNPGVAVLPQAVTNVSKVELLIVYDGQKINKNVGLGFKEVNVFDGDGTVPPTGGSITPKADNLFVDGKNWEYFDDRLWNRNYDDYQDLYGYYGVKKGVDTKNKFVYAHTYVYSPTSQNVQFRFGSSGKHRLFVNDSVITQASQPSEVQKDMSSANIVLNAGWNKILLQFQHTYTEDVNSNGVPIANDANVYYFGFYGRITDANGNEITNLTYSVTGDNPTLSIDTRGLSATDVVVDGKKGRGLPTNTLPTGYTEWPYVWYVPKSPVNHAVSSSAFRFLANGGTPGYTWSVVNGALPSGLTLNADGTIGGIVSAAPGTYTFTIKVTDASNATATKAFSIVVKDRPNRWFEEGRVSALSHSITVYDWWVDPNYSADLWAARAKRQGHSLVSVESLQQNYYWPSKFVDPLNDRNLYSPKDANGNIVDGLKPFEQAVKRYGMKFGLYYATQGTDVFVQSVEDLILRYDPAYFFFDGPQWTPNANYDVMYSIVRNYGDDIIVNSNTQSAWGGVFGDADLRVIEASNIYSAANDDIYSKRTIMEPWKIIATKNNSSSFPRRDDYRLVAKEMIMNAGRGFVDNNDQMPLFSRGPNFDTPTDIATRYPKSVQEFIDVREGVAAWFAPDGKPERHESTTGTKPYFISGYGYTDDGQGNIAKFEAGQGPTWGYAMSRDNNIYLHLIVGPDGKQGYSGNSLTISPVNDTVTSISLLNEDRPLGFTQTGTSVTIDLTGVTRDQVDTIVKIVTNNSLRNYQLTNLVLTGKQLTPGSLEVDVEGYMKYPALKVRFAQGSIGFSSNNTSVATVDASGVVRPVGDGTAAITATGTYEGVTKSDVLNVAVKSGSVYVKDTMIGASLWVEGRETYGAFSSLNPLNLKLEGRSAKGGPIGLDTATITMKAGTVNLSGGDLYHPVSIQESAIVSFANGIAIPQPVTSLTRAAIWAEVTLDGQTFTTNKVFLDLLPYENRAKNAIVTASGSLGNYTPDKVLDGQKINGANFDNSKWSVSGIAASWIKFELPEIADIKNIEINYNSLNQNYYNTPKTIEIQTSADGTNWQTVKTVTPPTTSIGAYFGFSDVYDIQAYSKYVRLNFPNGGNSINLDLLEVAINGVKSRVQGYWKLDETSGTIASDSSGFNNTGTVSGTPAWTPGRIQNGLALNGTDTYVTASNLVSTQTDNITMSAWVKWNGASSNHQVIFYNGNSATSGYGIYLDYANGNKLGLLAGGAGLLLSQTTLPIGQWTQVTGIRRSGIWGLYVNGSNVPIANNTVTPRTPAGSTVLGAAQGVQVFNGVIDEVKFFNVPLSDADILGAYNHDINLNLALNATVTASSQFYDNYAPVNVIDGITGQNGIGEWASAGEANPWIKLAWGVGQTVDKIVLYDRPNSTDWSSGGTLTFSDGSSVTVTGIPNDGTAATITFASRNVTWVKFQVTNSSGSNNGLSEFQVFNN